MSSDQLKLSDELVITRVSSIPITFKEYEVTAEAGLFKNGQHYPKGSLVPLSEKAATNFLREGEVKEVANG